MKKRIFVGLKISEEAKQKISKYIETLREAFPYLRVGWERTEKLHLTLKFLGEIENWKLENVITAVEKTARQIPTFIIKIAETGIFSTPKKAKILWLDVKGETEKLINLNSTLENECKNQGFERENRNFQPHLTIARLREPQNSRRLIEKHLQETFEPVSFEVSEIVIFQSKLQPAGSVYELVKSEKLNS